MPGPWWYQAIAYLMVGSLPLAVLLFLVGAVVHCRNPYKGSQLWAAAAGNWFFGCLCLIALMVTSGIAGTDGSI